MATKPVTEVPKKKAAASAPPVAVLPVTDAAHPHHFAYTLLQVLATVAAMAPAVAAPFLSEKNQKTLAAEASLASIALGAFLPKEPAV